MKRDTNNDIQAKTKYHHGDLRETLIDAVEQLVIEKGADNFSLADACRLAGVSTAAPYRHFQDREEILSEVLSRAFDKFRSRSAEAVAQHGAGTPAAIIALGKSYVSFAVEHTALFRLMFGQKPELKELPDIQDCSRDCLGIVIEQISLYCNNNNIQRDPLSSAIVGWTFVHGAASLLIDNDYVTVAPQVDLEYVHQMLEGSLMALLNEAAMNSSKGD